MDGLVESDLVEDEAKASEESEDDDETVPLLVQSQRRNQLCGSTFASKVRIEIK